MAFNMLFMVFISLVLLTSVKLTLAESDVVVLDTSNFEHLTQASTGMTTGDWLIEFYAPWCGHCKHLAPVYEEVATALKGEVNVAKVDAAAHRALGSRFEVKGFPTILFLSHGQVYKYKGKRTKEAFVAFAKGGYKEVAEQAEAIPEPKGVVGEFVSVFTKAWKASMKDISQGKFMTPNVLTVVMPSIFAFIMLVLVCIPAPTEPKPKRVRRPLNATKPSGEAAAAAENDKDK